MIYPDFHTHKFEGLEDRVIASQLPPAQRQTMLKNVLYPYDDFVIATEKIRQFHRPVMGGEPNTGWIGGLLGEYRSGKTFILQNFARQFQPKVTDEGFEHEVIYIQARQDWDALEMGKQVYIATGFPALPRLTVSSQNSKVAKRIIEAKVKLVIIDDAHYLFETAGRRSAAYVSLIKYLVDQVNACSALLAGPPRIEVPIQNDKQLSGRGGFPKFHIEGFDITSRYGRDKFRTFLHGVDERLPFRTLSDLASKKYLPDLLELTDGSLGFAMNIVIAAGFQAINDETACIMPEHLRKAAQDRVPTGKVYAPFAMEDAR